MSLEDLFFRTVATMLSPFVPTSRIFVLYLFTAFILAFVAYWQVEKAHEAEERAEGHPVRKRTGFFEYVFDPKVWLHPSSIQDMKFFAANALLYYGLISQFLIGAHLLSFGFYELVVSWFGAPTEAVISGATATVLYTIASVIALDLGVYVMHLLFHKVPFLWNFHKVHHSAEQLNPMTLFRMHPVDLFLTSLVVMFFQAVAFAGFFFLMAKAPSASMIFGVNLIVFVFYVAGYNLRHSHIWLNYPVWLSKILISPAQHQVHHSSDPKHFDRNMGLIFSFWDQMCGTHYIPRERENLQYGLSRSEPNPFNSVAEIYIKPFKWAWRDVKSWFATPHSRSIVYASLLATLGAGLLAYLHIIQKQIAYGPAQPSVHLQQLTWTEVHAAIRRGNTSVIVPTAGTEQNGPFVILGKHNMIAAYTSEKVAKSAGKTLVAPVLDYVPEGDIDPKPTGHMKYAGTLTVSQDLFEKVLEQTARSLKLHGFKEIYFLGESGDSQKGQEAVSERLSKKWASEGVTVVSLDRYYSGNGQFDYLLSKGYTKEEIGFHAGIRDTSEVMALDPASVRLTRRNMLKGMDLGLAGAPAKATAAIGRKMLQLKIEAAVEQIRQVRAKLQKKSDDSDKIAATSTLAK
ncbi:MAG: creatininase family protein [Hyphomicrobiaceae bacterium]